jgi:hypothetical protein
VDELRARCIVANGLHCLVVDGAVHQGMQRVSAEAPVHLGDHEAYDQRGNRIEDRVPARLPTMPKPTTGDDAASDLARQASATSNFDFTRLATDSM